MSEMYFSGFGREKFNEEQKIIIDQGYELGYSEDQMKVIMDPKLSWEQMYEMQQGFENGLSVEQVKGFAVPNLSWEQMNKERMKLENEMNLKNTKEVLANHSSTKEILDILNQNGMMKEAVEYLSLLCNLDALSTIVDRQEKAIHELEGQVQEMKKPSIKERAEAIIQDAKDDIQDLKDKVNGIKKEIIERSKELVDIYKAKGKLAFCKVFQEFSHLMKKPFFALKRDNERRFSKASQSIDKLAALRDEARKAGTGIRNIGRLLLGRETKDFKEDKHLSGVLDVSINTMNKQRKMMNSVDKFCLNCIGKLDSLEKSFGERARERKHDLNSLINNASKRTGTKEHEVSKEKNADRSGR